MSQYFHWTIFHMNKYVIAYLWLQEYCLKYSIKESNWNQIMMNNYVINCQFIFQTLCYILYMYCDNKHSLQNRMILFLYNELEEK